MDDTAVMLARLRLAHGMGHEQSGKECDACDFSVIAAQLETEIEHLRQGLAFIDANIGIGGNGEGWLASDNSRVTKALLGDDSGRLPLTDEDWDRLNFILGWNKP